MKRILWVAALFLAMGATGLLRAQDQALAYYQSGNSFYFQKDYDRAIHSYQSAVQISPGFWQAYQGLGNCYYAQGGKPTALAYYQKALFLNPNNPQLTSFVQTLQAQLASAPPLPANNEVGAPPLPVNNGSAALPMSANPAASSYPSPAGTSAGMGNEVEIDISGGGDLILSASNPIPATLISSALSAVTAYGLPIPTLSGGYGAGGGGGVAVYFPLSRNFSLGVNTAFRAYGSNYNYSLSGIYQGTSYTAGITETTSQTDLEFLASGKVYFDGSGVRPYLLGGGGFSLVSYSGAVSLAASQNGPYGSYGYGFLIPATSIFCPMFEAGAGIKFLTASNLDFFTEAKVGFVIVNGVGQTIYIPTYGNYTYESSSYTLIELPIDVGLSF